MKFEPYRFMFLDKTDWRVNGENADSPPITAAKERWAWLVQGHVTAREWTPCALGIKFGEAMSRNGAGAPQTNKKNNSLITA